MDLDNDYCYFLLSDFDTIDNNCEFYIRHNDKGKLFPILSYFQFKEEYTEKNTTMYKMIRPTYTLKVKKNIILGKSFNGSDWLYANKN